MFKKKKKRTKHWKQEKTYYLSNFFFFGKFTMSSKQSPKSITEILLLECFCLQVDKDLFVLHPTFIFVSTTKQQGGSWKKTPGFPLDVRPWARPLRPAGVSVIHTARSPAGALAAPRPLTRRPLRLEGARAESPTATGQPTAPPGLSRTGEAPAAPSPGTRASSRARPRPRNWVWAGAAAAPGAASPTFSGQEGGRPTAFPVVQLKRADTSLHSDSLGCQRPRGQSSATSRAGRARRAGEGRAAGFPRSCRRSPRLGVRWAARGYLRRARGARAGAALRPPAAAPGTSARPRPPAGLPSSSPALRTQGKAGFPRAHRKHFPCASVRADFGT